MSDPIAATRAWGIKRAEDGLVELAQAEKLLRAAVRQCDGLRGTSTSGDYPTSIPHPIQWDIDKLVMVIRTRLEAQRGANLNRT